MVRALADQRKYMRRIGLGATLGGRSVMNAAAGQRFRSSMYGRYQQSGGANAEYLAEEERRVRPCVFFFFFFSPFLSVSCCVRCFEARHELRTTRRACPVASHPFPCHSAWKKANVCLLLKLLFPFTGVSPHARTHKKKKKKVIHATRAAFPMWPLPAPNTQCLVCCFLLIPRHTSPHLSTMFESNRRSSAPSSPSRWLSR